MQEGREGTINPGLTANFAAAGCERKERKGVKSGERSENLMGRDQGGKRAGNIGERQGRLSHREGEQRVWEKKWEKDDDGGEAGELGGERCLTFCFVQF